MSSEPLPEEIEQGIQRFATERRLSHKDAVILLIEAGLEAQYFQPSAASSRRAEVTRARQAEMRKATRLALADSRPVDPDGLIGFLQGAPQVAEDIRQLALERRRETYGS